MRFVRTLKALSPALVNLVTKEMARSVEVILKSALMYLIITITKLSNLIGYQLP